MKILHTGDWHLGKYLEGFSRLEEQEKFVEDFIHIVEDKEIQLVIITGDIYDNSNPPAGAEKLFYRTIKRISNNGERLVLIIAGNHDNPDRLVASSPLAFEDGIIIVDKPKSKIETGRCGNHEVVVSGEGYFEVEVKGERAVVITLPYPSEKRLNEVLSISMEEEEAFQGYSDRIKQFFDERKSYFREDTINLVASHLFVIGGEESGSERAIQLGGTLAVRASSFPDNAHYVALGHLHGPQEIKSSTRVYYAGSPLQYSKSEATQSKGCFIAEIQVGKEPSIEKIMFKNYKPIDIWKCKSIAEAIELCKDNEGRESWVYLEIETDRIIEQEEIKQMKSFKKDILEIKPKIISSQEEAQEEFGLQDKPIETLFYEFFKNKNGVEPREELMNTFMEIVYGEEEDVNETQITEN
jgi:DNA repair protein SbcD/Mre11